MELWIANWRRLGMEARWREYLPLLTEAERSKALRFLREPDRIRSVTGTLLIRAALAERFAPEERVLSYNAYGKPNASAGGFCFNLSHSGDLVVLATAGNEVGVDVEQRRQLDWKESFGSTLTAEEARFMNASGDATDSFYYVWTVREAFSKLVGVGLSLFEGDENFDIRYGEGEIVWRGKTLRITSFVHDGHRISAVCAPEETARIRILTKEEWDTLCAISV